MVTSITEAIAAPALAENFIFARHLHALAMTQVWPIWLPPGQPSTGKSHRIDPPDGRHRRTAIRSGEESVLCSTALLRRGFISADS
ncbi:MAG: hypothetical protein IPH39_05295 [Sulfuritalea sp.]|jgi:hypothetical protein|nr:hypothetical protein [Sulfuritalea sp.]